MRYPAYSVPVHLESWEHAHTLYVGQRRHEIRLTSGNAAHYDPARMEDNLTASRAAACVEAAVAKYKGLYWGGHYWEVADHDKYREMPDVGENIEVRRIREPHNPVAVRRRDKIANRLIVCGWADPDTAFQTVYLVGEIPAKDGWLAGMIADYDPQNTRLVMQAFLDTYSDRLVVS